MRTPDSRKGQFDFYQVIEGVCLVVLPPAALYLVIPVAIAGAILAFCLHGVVMEVVNLVRFNTGVSWYFLRELVLQLTGAAVSILVPYCYARLLRRLPPTLQIGELSVAVYIGLTWLTYICAVVVTTIQLTVEP
jgi:hypothetical protein